MERFLHILCGLAITAFLLMAAFSFSLTVALGAPFVLCAVAIIQPLIYYAHPPFKHGDGSRALVAVAHAAAAIAAPLWPLVLILLGNLILVQLFRNGRARYCAPLVLVLPLIAVIVFQGFIGWPPLVICNVLVVLLVLLGFVEVDRKETNVHATTNRL